MKKIIFLIILLSMHLSGYCQTEDDKICYKKYFKYSYTDTNSIVWTQPLFETRLPIDTNYARVEYFKGNWKYLTYEFIKILRKYITLDEFKQLTLDNTSSRIRIIFDFNSNGNIIYCEFIIPYKNLSILTDEKLYSFSNDIKNIKVNMNDMNWWLGDRIAPREKLPSLKGGGTIPLFFNYKDALKVFEEEEKVKE